LAPLFAGEIKYPVSEIPRQLLKDASAMLFVAAKVSHLALLPQVKAEATRRVQAIVSKMDELRFGNCTNTGACEAECPKEISIDNIARMKRKFLGAEIDANKRSEIGSILKIHPSIELPIE